MANGRFTAVFEFSTDALVLTGPVVHELTTLGGWKAAVEHAAAAFRQIGTGSRGFYGFACSTPIRINVRRLDTGTIFVGLVVVALLASIFWMGTTGNRFCCDPKSLVGQLRTQLFEHPQP